MEEELRGWRKRSIHALETDDPYLALEVITKAFVYHAKNLTEEDREALGLLKEWVEGVLEERKKI